MKISDEFWFGTVIEVFNRRGQTERNSGYRLRYAFRAARVWPQSVTPYDSCLCCLPHTRQEWIGSPASDWSEWTTGELSSGSTAIVGSNSSTVPDRRTAEDRHHRRPRSQPTVRSSSGWLLHSCGPIRADLRDRELEFNLEFIVNCNTPVIYVVN